LGPLVACAVHQFVDEHRALADDPRYPIIFSTLKKLLETDDDGNEVNESDLYVLSFGCGGVERDDVPNLRSAFPQAVIHGVEYNSTLVNKQVLANKDERVSYFTSVPLKMHPLSPVKQYDVAIAINVFSNVKFSDFKEAMRFLHNAVKSSGYIVIYNSKYNFKDIDNFGNWWAPLAENCDKDGKGIAPADCTQAPWKGAKTCGKDGKAPGMCGGKGNKDSEYCIESGWEPKMSPKEVQIQEPAKGAKSNGCKFPGVFYRKKKYGADPPSGWPEEVKKDFDGRDVGGPLKVKPHQGTTKELLGAIADM